MVLAALVLPLFAGCASPPPTDVGPQVATASDVSGQPTEAPPANQKDVIPACPGSRAQWWLIDGHWDWRGKWVWVPGHWRVRRIRATSGFAANGSNRETFTSGKKATGVPARLPTRNPTNADLILEAASRRPSALRNAGGRKFFTRDA